MSNETTTISREALTASLEQAKARIAALEAAMNAKATSRISYKVSEKGAVSIYGLGRFPFTFYASQWDAFISALPATKAFVEANRHLLTVKD